MTLYIGRNTISHYVLRYQNYCFTSAQMGLEDAGVIISLLKELCTENNGRDGIFLVENFGNAMKVYEKMRVPRTEDILARSKLWGKTQQKRSKNKKYNQVKEELIKRDVFYHETMKALKPAAAYDFQQEVRESLKIEPAHLPLISKGEVEPMQ